MRLRLKNRSQKAMATVTCVIVPTAAIQTSPDSKFVYIVKEQGPATQPDAATEPAATGAAGGGKEHRPQAVVEMRNVVVGPQEGEETVVTKGVEPGDVVVTVGVDKLEDGARVTIGSPGDAASQPATAAGTQQGGRRKRHSQ